MYLDLTRISTIVSISPIVLRHHFYLAASFCRMFLLQILRLLQHEFSVFFQPSKETGASE